MLALADYGPSYHMLALADYGPNNHMLVLADYGPNNHLPVPKYHLFKCFFSINVFKTAHNPGVVINPGIAPF